MPLSDLNALITANAQNFLVVEQNINQVKAFSAVYHLLQGGVPSISGFTSLITNNNSTNFGSATTTSFGPIFNIENVFINVANALFQGNPSAQSAFNTIASGNTLSDKLTSIYNTLVDTSEQTEQGRAAFAAQSAFYQNRATELGIPGDTGGAVVAFGALLNILVRDNNIGIGNSVNDLLKAIGDGSAAIPDTSTLFTPIETADGTNYDGDDGSGGSTTGEGIVVNGVIKVGTETDLSGRTELNSGVIVDFQNAASTGKGLTLNATQNGIVTFINTNGSQTITVAGEKDSFTVADGIEKYSVVGGSAITVTDSNSSVSIETTTTASSVINIPASPRPVSGTYNAISTSDFLIAGSGANITFVTGMNTIENLTMSNSITMTDDQYAGFNTINGATASDGINIANSFSSNLNAHASVESYFLTGSGNAQMNFNIFNTTSLTDEVRKDMSVSVGGGAVTTTIQIAQGDIDNNIDSSINFTNFSTNVDKFQLFLGGGVARTGFQTLASNGENNVTVGPNSVIEVNDGINGQYGTSLSNFGEASGYINSAIGTIADGNYNIVIYKSSTDAGIYQMSVSGGSTNAASLSIDAIELIGVVSNIGGNALGEANFI